MLGEKLGRSTGKVTARRVLRDGSMGVKIETTFEASGKILGVDVREYASYWSALRPDGTIYGEGQGVLMGKSGEMGTWIGQGVGTIGKDGSAKFRGTVYIYSASPKWVRLNTVGAAYEYSADARGRTKSDLWEWK